MDDKLKAVARCENHKLCPLGVLCGRATVSVTDQPSAYPFHRAGHGCGDYLPPHHYQRDLKVYQAAHPNTSKAVADGTVRIRTRSRPAPPSA